MWRAIVLPVAALVAGAGAFATPARAERPPVRIVFAGDIMLDGGPGHLVTTGRDPFAEVAAALGEADLTIGNLECAIVKQGHAEDKPFTFRGPERALPFLKQHFSAVSLANNHSGDWGKAGFLTELELLRATKLPYFGGGATRSEAHKPLVLTAAGRRVALLGYNDFPPRRFAAGRSSPGTAWLVEKDVVADIRTARREADLVLLFLHWGEDLQPEATPEQRALARRLIEAGADAVIGGHPHLTQTIDWYEDRPIVYSLGNFVFDYYPYDPPVWTGWIVKLTFGESGRPGLDVTTVELDPAGIPHLVPSPREETRRAPPDIPPTPHRPAATGIQLP
jgi:poly-gamma-glutamate capsule biosynthesis protein CapA/YwtB (metallophosphatase superfamily)